MRLITIFLLIFLVFNTGSCKREKELKPVDFDEFWNLSLEELNDIPLDFEKVSKDSVIEGKRINLYKIRSYEDIFFYAWVSEPLSEGKYPVKIRFSGLGEKNIDKKKIAHFWFLKQNNFINMLVDIRGQGLSTDQVNPKDYISEGIKSKETFIYRGAYMDAVRSVDFISKNIKCNGQIIVTGGSQGGALSVAVAALNEKVSICVASFPFLTDIQNYDKKNWPMKIWFHEAEEKNISYFDLQKTLSYFDLINFTDKIDIPVFLRTEEYDDITPADGTIRFFNLLKGQKKALYIEPCKGHGCSTNSAVANEMEKVFIRENLNKKN